MRDCAVHDALLRKVEEFRAKYHMTRHSCFCPEVYRVSWSEVRVAEDGTLYVLCWARCDWCNDAVEEVYRELINLV